MSEAKPHKISLMLDSGAFSAWSRGDKIELSDYIEFIKHCSSLLYCYVNLDTLPPGLGNLRTPEDFESSASKSYETQQKMKAEGLTPIPVFHQGESFSWLDRMLMDGEAYIGISANKEIPSKQQRMKWYDECFTRLTNSNGVPLVKVHGFGTTDCNVMKRYPWASVDSTTWSLHPGYGHVLVPRYVNNKVDYLSGPISVIVSDRQVKTGKSKLFLDELSEEQLYSLEKYLSDVVGVTLTDIRYFSNSRRKTALLYFLGFQKALGAVVFQHRKFSFVSGFGNDGDAGDPSIRLNIIFATSLTSDFEKILSEVNASYHLLSFYEFMPRNKIRRDSITFDQLEMYVKTGMFPRNKKTSSSRIGWQWEGYLNARRRNVLNRIKERKNETR